MGLRERAKAIVGWHSAERHGHGIECDTCVLIEALEHAERVLSETHVLLGGALEALAADGVVRLDQSVRQQILDLRARLAEAEQQRDHFRSLLKAP